jgi:hypothetical protein
MSKHKIKTNNGNGGLAWIQRPAKKMNSNLLNGFGQKIKKFAKRYSSKKRRTFLKNETE